VPKKNKKKIKGVIDREHGRVTIRCTNENLTPEHGYRDSGPGTPTTEPRLLHQVGTKLNQNSPKPTRLLHQVDTKLTQSTPKPPAFCTRSTQNSPKTHPKHPNHPKNSKTNPPFACSTPKTHPKLTQNPPKTPKPPQKQQNQPAFCMFDTQNSTKPPQKTAKPAHLLHRVGSKPTQNRPVGPQQ
jgi:hypothetical protein